MSITRLAVMPRISAVDVNNFQRYDNHNANQVNSHSLQNIAERSKFHMSNDFTLDNFAKLHFGNVMEELGFTVFHQHRWHKLIQDEVLLSFGLIPEGFGLYSVKFGFQPLFLSRFIPPTKEENFFWLPFYYDVDILYRNMSYPKRDRNYNCEYKNEYDKEWKEIINKMPDHFLRPVILSITDVRSAYKMAIWFSYIMRRESNDYQQPPIPEHFYMGCHYHEEVDALLFFHMYDECKDGIKKRNESTLRQFGGKVPPDFLDYLDVLERKDYDWIEQYFHKNYDNSLLSIKRKLRLEPDCKGSLWDEANRAPIDIRQVLEEKFRTCVREDYSIVSF